MSVQRIDLSDDGDDFETVLVDGRPRKILKDRRRVHFRMTDAAPVLDLHDGYGGPPGHRPGFVVATDQKLADGKERAYQDYWAELRQAYQNPTDHSDTDSPPNTIPRRQQDASVSDSKEAAYRDYRAHMQNAWRG